jgi:hypothetical protein
MSASYAKFIAGAKVFKVLVGLGLLFLIVGIMGAAWSSIPTGNLLLDALLWWAGLYGLTFGGALATARLRVRIVGDIETGDRFPFANLLADVGTLILGVLLTAYFLPDYFENPDAGNLGLSCMGGILILFSVFSLIRHATRE